MSMRSVHKALDILESIGSSRQGNGGLTVSDISRALDMPTSTVGRFLTALVEKGLVFRDPRTRKYGLSWKMAELGTSAVVAPRRFQVMIRLLTDLVGSVQETASMVWKYGYGGVYGLEIPCARTLRAIHEPGSSAPLHCTAFGKVLLGAYDPNELGTYIEETGLPEYTRFTITNAYALREQLQEIRRQGFAIEKHEWEIGAGSVAALVSGGEGIPFGAIGVTGAVARLEDYGYENLGRQIVLAATELSAIYGFHPSVSDELDQAQETQ